MTVIKRHKYFKPQEYKDMDPLELINIYNPLITSLCDKYGDSGRLSEDLRQELSIELLRLQGEYKPETKNHFSAYIYRHLIGSATKARQKHFGAIYIQHTSCKRLVDKGENNPMYTDEITKHRENQQLCCEDTTQQEENSFTILKIILTALKNSNLSNEKKLKMRSYLKEYFNTGKLSSILAKYLKPILNETVLKNYYK